MIKKVSISSRLRFKGITENHRGFPKHSSFRIFGADTETVNGRPYTVQISNGSESFISKVSEKNVFKKFIEWIEEHRRENGVNLCFFHNLNFDLRVLFRKNVREIYDQYNDIRFRVDGYRVRMLFGRVNTATIWKGKRQIVRLVDSAAFCPPGAKSFKAALKIYGVEGTKLDQPKGLGEKRLWSKAFRDYALNDAIQEQKLGQKLMDMHEEYDVTPCVSLPQFAGRVLRHHFFRPGESIVFPPEPCRIASELSYHAGKNGFYVRRGVYEDLYEYDINSAFPRAMRELPQMVRGGYEWTVRYEPGFMGVYEVSGNATAPRYPAIFDHGFKPIHGYFDRIWVTGFEIQLMREDPAYKFQIRQGWIWRPDLRYNHSPLAEFVDRFWHLKSTTPKGPKRDTYKNILNSLYGKFAACVEKRPTIETGIGTFPDTSGAAQGKDRLYVAGALYHPFIAGQITGYVRRELTRLERAGQALHSATDSIKSFKNLPSSDELGGIKREVFGRCYLFRTKLYLHFSRDNSLCGHDLDNGWIWNGKDRSGKIFEPDGQHLCKWALHGFKGTALELYRVREELLRTGVYEYEYEHMTNLREGVKRREQMCRMNRRKEVLRLKEGQYAGALGT